MSHANDMFANAISLSGSSGSNGPIVIDSAANPATSESGEDVYGAGQTLWWKWTCPADGWYFFTTYPSEGHYVSDTAPFDDGLDTKMQLFTGDFSSSLVSNDDVDDRPERLYFNSEIKFLCSAGTEYFIQVDLYRTNQVGSLNLSWGVTTGPPPPPPPPPVDLYSVSPHVEPQYLSYNAVAYGRTFDLSGSGLNKVTRLRLPGGQILAEDFITQTDSLIVALCPTTVGGGDLLADWVDGSTSGSEPLPDVTVWKPESSFSRTRSNVHLDRVLGWDAFSSDIDGTNGSWQSYSIYRIGASHDAAEAADFASLVQNYSQYVAFPASDPAYNAPVVQIHEEFMLIRFTGGFQFPKIAGGNPPPAPPGYPFNYLYEYVDHASGDTFGPSTKLFGEALAGDITTSIRATGIYQDNVWVPSGYRVYQPLASDLALRSLGRPAHDATAGKRINWFEDHTPIATGHLTDAPLSLSMDFNVESDVARFTPDSNTTLLWNTTGTFVGPGMRATAISAGAFGWTSEPLVVEPGMVKTWRAWINASSSASLMAYFDWYDASDALISSSPGGPYTSFASDSYFNSSWVPNSTAPAGAKKVKVRVVVTGLGAGGTFTIDNFSLAHITDSGAPHDDIPVTIGPEHIVVDDTGDVWAAFYMIDRAYYEARANPMPTDHQMHGSTLWFGSNPVSLLVHADYTPSNYRYWLPYILPDEVATPPPLRQRGRDDGLASDSRQEKSQGSSQQLSLRRGGRTYY